jgi:very-short-patch-repair endonuclease
LVVEVDGGQHLQEAAERYDAERSTYLNSRGLRVLRFANVEVLTMTDGVVEEIAGAVPAGRQSP